MRFLLLLWVIAIYQMSFSDMALQPLSATWTTSTLDSDPHLMQGTIRTHSFSCNISM